ncbi:MAG: shikimate kinase [Phycisphaerales bacterium]|nr:shikimate kinase [Phycisphaerales bacterium]MCB9835614.1 shikimate kinase [Phycisphaera sp.]
MLRSIVLMGLRGSGKSTVGPMLASKLGFDFQDLDEAVLADSACATIADIVRTEGWEGFRSREREQLEVWLWALDTLPEKRLVLALGGGVPTHDPSRVLLQSAELHGIVALVYLRAQPETLAKRMASSADRPSLTGKDPIEEIRDVFNQRDELYRSIADIVIDIDALDAQATAQAIESALKQL